MHQRKKQSAQTHSFSCLKEVQENHLLIDQATGGDWRRGSVAVACVYYLAWMAGRVADGCGGVASRRVSLL